MMFLGPKAGASAFGGMLPFDVRATASRGGHPWVRVDETGGVRGARWEKGVERVGSKAAFAEDSQQESTNPNNKAYESPKRRRPGHSDPSSSTSPFDLEFKTAALPVRL